MPDIWMDVDAALSEVPVNILPLIDDSDFKTREEAITYDQAGMDLVWNFVTTAGAFTQTAVTPTSGGVHDWASQGNGMYTIEIPDSGGTINNDTEGFGWFTGYATGVLPWRGPTIGFRAAGLNNALIDSAYSATRGLAGTDIDAILVDTAEIGAAGAGLTAVPWNAAWDAEVESEVDDALGGGTGTALTAIPWNAAWDAEVESEVDDALGGGTGTALTAIPWNAAWDAEVQSEVQDGIEANHLDHLLAATYDPAAKPGAADALLNEIVENDVGVSRFTQNALEQAPGGADGSGYTAIPWNAAWDAEVESEIIDALQTMLSDSVPANGTRPTYEQALYMIVQFLLERVITGTAVSIKKADHSTELFTCALSDPNDPVSITRNG